MQTTEVTQGQWKAVMGSNPSYFQNCGDDCPVEAVSWNDVQNFIRKLNQKGGNDTYRLPTEAEWEYAARAGSLLAFPNGDRTETGCGFDTNLDAIGWYCGNSNKRTHPVAQKQANSWGLYDMHGNVDEWCQDWYGGDYSSGAVTDPTGPSHGSYRIERGGGWHRDAGKCRSASRGRTRPDRRYGSQGFRLVMNPSQTISGEKPIKETTLAPIQDLKLQFVTALLATHMRTVAIKNFNTKNIFDEWRLRGALKGFKDEFASLNNDQKTQAVFLFISATTYGIKHHLPFPNRIDDVREWREIKKIIYTCEIPASIKIGFSLDQLYIIAEKIYDDNF